MHRHAPQDELVRFAMYPGHALHLKSFECLSSSGSKSLKRKPKIILLEDSQKMQGAREGGVALEIWSTSLGTQCCNILCTIFCNNIASILVIERVDVCGCIYTGVALQQSWLCGRHGPWKDPCPLQAGGP